jgi:hypothetical protein
MLYPGDTDFTIAAAKPSDINEILSTAASGKKRSRGMTVQSQFPKELERIAKT